jgi:hypothetical protein
MAEKPGAKAGAKKPEAKKVTDVDAASKLIVILVVVAILGALVSWLTTLFDGVSGETSAVGVLLKLFSATGILDALYRFAYGPFVWVSLLITVAFGAGAVYSLIQLKKIREAKKAEIRMLEAKLTTDASVSRNERWEHIEILVSSENPGDWRIAIIEADVALHELVRSMGYDGDTLGDMLKGVEKSDFTTLDLAWEAHKMRNRIAHQGSDFILTQREAKRIINLYRQVFEEFDVI